LGKREDSSTKALKDDGGISQLYPNRQEIEDSSDFRDVLKKHAIVQLGKHCFLFTWQGAFRGDE
jgi:hypothetical protein